MKMSKKAEKLLRKSIKHWKDDVLKEGNMPNGYSCALCDKYAFNPDFCTSINGIRCPIARAMNPQCVGTVYYDYRRLHYCGNTIKMKLCAQEMIDFMKNLLPKKGDK